MEFKLPNNNEFFDYSIKKYDEKNYELVVRKFPNGLKESTTEKINDEKLSNSISRSRTAIFEYSMVNDFDYFITLTLNPSKRDVFDLDGYIKNFGQFIRDLRKKYSTKIEYLLVPEKHKSGAWHLHGLIKGIPQEQLFKNNNGYLDWRDYKLKFGYASLSPVRNKVAISKYITKYITKGFGDNAERKNKKLYYNSRGLKKSEKLSKGKVLQSQLNLYLALNSEGVFDGDYTVKKSLNEKELEELFASFLLVQDID